MTNPPKTPTMDQLVFDIYFFYVPNRIVWDDWDKFIANEDYSVKEAMVLCNQREVEIDKDGITYLPVYYSMFIVGNKSTKNMILSIPKMPE